jgi:hypothetical protein
MLTQGLHRTQSLRRSPDILRSIDDLRIIPGFASKNHSQASHDRFFLRSSRFLRRSANLFRGRHCSLIDVFSSFSIIANFLLSYILILLNARVS